MKLIIGLGNPGKEYQNTRHNIGYMAVSLIAEKNNAQFKLDTKLEGEIASFIENGEKVFLLKPVTYMNLSGNSVSKVINYYKIDIKDILVIYDDMSLPLGHLRLRTHGSAGGHNGIKNIIEHIGLEFFRAKIGIDHGKDAKDYVLGNFGKEENIEIGKTLDVVYEMTIAFIRGNGFEALMNKYN